MDYFQYSIKDDARAKELKELLENNTQLLNFLMSLLDLADEYITEMYDLSSESDIEEDDPNDPDYSTESDEDDY